MPQVDSLVNYTALIWSRGNMSSLKGLKHSRLSYTTEVNLNVVGHTNFTSKL